MHKIPKLGLTSRQLALEPMLPTITLHSQGNVLEEGRLGPRRTAGLGAESEPFALLQAGWDSGGLGVWGNVELMALGFASSEQSIGGGRVWVTAGNRSSEKTTASARRRRPAKAERKEHSG